MKAVSLNDTLLNDPNAASQSQQAADQQSNATASEQMASMGASAPASQTTDLFFTAQNQLNKHKIVKRYVRNDLPPVQVCELNPLANPRVVYTLLVRSDENPLAQRLFLLGANPKSAKQLSDEVYEVNLTASQPATPKSRGTSKKRGKSASSTTNQVLMPRSKMPVLKNSYGCCVGSADDVQQQIIFVLGGQGIDKKATAKCEQYIIAEDRWEAMPELPAATYSLSCLHTHTDQLFAFGGYNVQD